MAGDQKLVAFYRTYRMGEGGEILYPEVKAAAERMGAEQVQRDILEKHPDAVMQEPWVSEWEKFAINMVDPETGEPWVFQGWEYTVEIKATVGVAPTEGVQA